MDESEWKHEREKAIHLLRSGQTASAAATQLGRSVSWVYKWHARYREAGGVGLASRSRAPQHTPQRYAEATRQLICQTRSALEASRDAVLRYIGPTTVRARLMEQGIDRVPGPATIGRVLRAAGMTRPKRPSTRPETVYPRLHPTASYQGQQIDIAPPFLPGGPAVACFHGLDVVSRYAFGVAARRKQSTDAAAFLRAMGRAVGIATYMDNESCFCGGYRPPYVLGKVVRLCLRVGTHPVFTPYSHPESNGGVERFHQEYNRHVWDRHHLDTLEAVNTCAQAFFTAYCRAPHPAPLHGLTPQQAHGPLSYRLPAHFPLALNLLPLTEGQVHFIRQVSQAHTIHRLNVDWPVPTAHPQQGVWATLTLTPQGATLSVYDDAPDAPHRRCLAHYPFPLHEPVQPLSPCFRRQPAEPLPSQPLRSWRQRLGQAVRRLSTIVLIILVSLAYAHLSTML